MAEERVGNRSKSSRPGVRGKRSRRRGPERQRRRLRFEWLEERQLLSLSSIVPTATLTGLSVPQQLAFNSSNDLFVANSSGTTVSEFAPGSTVPMATLTGLSQPNFLAFDASGDLYVSNGIAQGTVSKFAPGATTASATLTGLNFPGAVAVDALGDVFVANYGNGVGLGGTGSTVSEFAPGSSTPTATLTGLDGPFWMAFDSSGNLYVTNQTGNTVSEFAPGATTAAATLTGLQTPDELMFGPNGNLYVTSRGNNSVSEFAPGSTTPSVTLSGLDSPRRLAFDSSGDLFVANTSGNTVSEFVPGATTPNATLLGLTTPFDLAFDSRGDLFVASQGSNTVAEFSAAGPSLVGGEFQVNSYTTGAQDLPRVATDSAGDYVVVWQSQGEDGSGYGIYAQRYNAAGVAQGSQFRVNTYTTGNQTEPAVAMDSAGDFTVSWESGDGANYGVFAQRYNASGVAEGSQFQVNTYTTAVQHRPTIAMDQEGDFVIAWQSDNQDGSGYGVYAQRYNSFGVAQGSEFRVNTYTTGDQAGPAAAMDAEGDFVIAWQSDNQDGSQEGVYAQRYNAAGVAQGSEFRVNTYTTGGQGSPSVAMDSVGDFVIAWNSNPQDGSDIGIYAQRYNASGLTQGGEFRVNTYTTGAQNYSGVSMDAAGDFIVSWASNGEDGSDYGIYAQSYNASGVKQGNEFRVNTYTTGNQGGPPAAGFSHEGAPGVAMDAAGDLVVAWQSYGEDGSSYGVYAQRYASLQTSTSDSPIGGEFQVNTYTAGAQVLPQVATDSAGDYVVVWQSNVQDGSDYGIYAQRYNSSGVAEGSEFRVNTYTTDGQNEPAVAMDAEGDFVIAWRDLSGADGGSDGISAQRYNAAGVPQGSQFQVDTNTAGVHVRPTVAMDSEGDFVIGWQADSEDGSDYGVFARQYNAAGVAQGSQFQVNTFTTNNQETIDIAMDSGGDFVAAWTSNTEDGGSYGVYAQRYSASGVAEGSEFRVNTYTTNSQGHPGVAMDSEGDFVVSWAGYGPGAGYDVFAQVYNSAGVAQGSQFQVNTYTSTKQNNDTVAIDAQGDFLVSWVGQSGEDGSGNGVYAQAYNAAGVPQGSQFQVNTYTTGNQGGTVGSFSHEGGPSVAMDAAGDFVVAWQSYGEDGSSYGVYAQRYATVTTSTSGSPNGSEFRINTYTPGAQIGAQVATDAAGDFVVVWESYQEDGSKYGIFAQRYNAAGVAQGSEFQVNTYTTGDQENPTVAMDSQGDFIIAWQDRSGEDGSTYGVFARRYNAAGVSQGTQFQVNTYTTNSQRDPSAAMDAEGDFIITWSSNTEDGSDYGIYAQRYASSGVAVGSEFQVNAYTTNTQRYSAVAMDSAGDFVITWSSYGQDPGKGVYAQRYNAAGVRQGSEFQVNTYTTDNQMFPAVAMDSAGDFVITWQSNTEDGSGYGAYAQRYNAAGVPQGSEFQVNSFTTDTQIFPHVSMDSAGDFVITWASYGEDGSGYGVYAQQYAAAGTAVEGEFRVNTYTTGNQAGKVSSGAHDGGDAVAMDAAGDFVTAWQGYGEDGSSWGIYAQRFQAAAAPSIITSSGALTYTVASGAQQIDPNLSLSDSESTTIDGATVSFASGYAGSQDILNFTDELGISGSYSAGTLTLTGTASVADYQTALKSVTYADMASNPSFTPRTIGFSVNDGLASSSTATRTIDLVAGAGAQLVFGVQPPASVTAGIGFGLTIDAEDALGNLASSYSGSVTLALGNNPGGSTLGGTTTAIAVNGVAVFSNLTLNKVDPGYTLDAISGTLIAASTSAISVSPGAATQLLIAVEPSATVTAGTGFGFTVMAEDVDGNFATGFAGTVTVAIGNNSGGSTLAGTTAVSASAGLAVFSGLSLNKVGTNYTLKITSGALAAATSSAMSVTPGAATQLSITSQPPATVTAGVGFSLTVTAEDAEGNVSTSFNGSETLALASHPGVSTLGGTVTVSATSGIASFNGLILNQAGNGYSLAVSSSTLAAATSSAISVSPGAATQLLISSQPPATVIAGVGFGLTVIAEDAEGNVATGFIGSETVTLVGNPGGNTLGGALTVPASSGVAVFSGITLHKADGGYTLAVHSGTISTGTSSAISVTPGAAATFVLSAAPASLTAGSATAVTVTAEDAFNNVVTGFSDSVMLSDALGGASFSANPVASFLGGLATVTATLNTAGTQTITATDSTATISGASSAISVAPGAATHLLITAQPPATVTIGSGFGFTVTAEDAQGNVATGFNGSETATLASNPGGSTLGGTMIVNATGGVAVFSDLTLNTVGSGYTLAVTSGTLASATSSAISVALVAATQLVITAQPASTVTAGSGFNFTVTAEDAQDNVATGFSGSETIALASNPGGGSLRGVLTVTATGGVAVFSGVSLNKAGSGYTLAVSSGTLSSATTSAISVAPGAATQLLIGTQPPSTVMAGNGFALSVVAEDAQGNVATGFTGSVTVALAANPGSSTLGGTLTVDAVAGVARFSGLNLNLPGSGYTLQLSSSGLTSAVTGAIIVPNMLVMTGTSNSNDNVTFTFTSANQFTVSSGGTTTPYSTTNFDQFMYDAPTDGTFSEFIFDDPGVAVNATQSLGTTTITEGNFQFQANGVTNLYLYGGTGSAATVNVDNGGSSSSNFFVVDTKNNYSYIADPGTKAYSELSGFGSETVTGSAGTTYAYIYSMSHATTVASPTQTTFTVGGVTSTLSNFPQVYVVGAADGSDSVTLDASGGTFVGTPGFSYVSGTSSGSTFLLGALYAANVTAQASSSGKDAAVFYSYPSNMFTGTPGTSSLAGSTTNIAGSGINFVSQALGFNSVSVFESGAGSDVANLTSPGNGSFFGTSTASTLTVGTSTITVNTYFVSSSGQTVAVPGQIMVSGAGDNTDSATIYDAPGNNALTASGSTATLTTALGSLSINKFGSVTANQENGIHDTIHEAAIDFALKTVGNWTSD